MLRCLPPDSSAPYAGRYVRLVRVRAATAEGSGASPVVLVHGAPDSWRDMARVAQRVVGEGEGGSVAARGRAAWVVSLPSSEGEGEREGATPSAWAAASGAVEREFRAAMRWVAEAASETGAVAVVAHDFGAELTWAWVRAERPRVEWMVAMSVGSGVRYDVVEHGVVGAAAWAYSLVLSVPYYLPWCSPVVRGVDALMRRFAGYRGSPLTGRSQVRR